MERQKTQIISYHCDSRSICIMVVVEETCAVAWALICEGKKMTELKHPMVSAITCLNDHRVLIGQGQSRGKGQARLVFSDWTDRFVAILVRKVSGLHIEKRRIGLEMREQVGGNLL